MALDNEEKRRASFNFAATPGVKVLPLTTGTIFDEDRAMLHGVYFAGAFPTPVSVYVLASKWYRGFSNRI